jgi:hypothetical protein
MKVGEGILECTLLKLIVALLTLNGASYDLRSFVDPNPNVHDGLIYSNNALQNCSIQYMAIREATLPTRGDSVEVTQTVSNVNDL